MRLYLETILVRDDMEVLAPSELILKACSESLTHKETSLPFDAAIFAITVPKLPPPKNSNIFIISYSYL